MEIIKTDLERVLLIKQEIFKDIRGSFMELYRYEKFYKVMGLKFVEDDISVSKQGVLRGIHSDNMAWKLLTCLYGAIHLVIVDCKDNSEDFGKWESFHLSGDSGIQILVPPKYGIVHLVLSNIAILFYKQTEFYNPSRQTTYRYDDARFGIEWPIKNPILSERDKCGIQSKS